MSTFWQKTLETISPWLLDHGLKILAIFIIALLIRRFGGVFIEKTVRRLVLSNRFLTKDAETKREDTLIRIFDTSLVVLVWLLAGLMMLEEAGTNIAPLLAAAGVAGLAFGFGGQYLIKDLISGLFIILENQYRIGDVVCIDDTCGLVEDISMRMTSLRDLDGTVHHIPHGSITKLR